MNARARSLRRRSLTPNSRITTSPGRILPMIFPTGAPGLSTLPRRTRYPPSLRGASESARRSLKVLLSGVVTIMVCRSTTSLTIALVLSAAAVSVHIAATKRKAHIEVLFIIILVLAFTRRLRPRPCRLCPLPRETAHTARKRRPRSSPSIAPPHSPISGWSPRTEVPVSARRHDVAPRADRSDFTRESDDLDRRPIPLIPPQSPISGEIVLTGNIKVVGRDV